MTCPTHLIECLRNKGIEPEAYASSFYDSKREPSNALIIDMSNEYSSQDSDSEPQWWSVNFKKKISLKGYTIRSYIPGTYSIALYNFTLSVSFDNKTWKVAQGPLQRNKEETTYELPNPVKAKFVRIDGNSLSSSNPQTIYFNYIKFYGSINIARCAASCKTKKGMNLDLLKMILILCK